MDALFRKVIGQTEGSFQYALLRRTRKKDPETLVISEVFEVHETGTANWNHPEESISYEVDGVNRHAEGIVFVNRPTDAVQTDIIYHAGLDRAYRIMGMVPSYSSHLELHVMKFALPKNFSLPSQPTTFLQSGANVV